ncbi:MAG TPA: sigma-70 family RNA polymerase sigma factor [Tepidisphaeraceae bacterium]|nr:sigma-70 family RNA polymerase sigma factor [Tepidisphaeraceae bacterium]
MTPSWPTLLRDHGPTVWRTAYRLLADRQDAEEVFQETFLAALEFSRAHDVRHWPALLQRLATTRSVDRLRRRYARRRHLPTVPDTADDGDTALDRVPTASASPLEHLQTAELSDRLRAALTHLPANLAEPFCLHALSGWSYQEIAQHLGLPSTSVGVNIHRARHKLRDLLAAFAPDSTDPATTRN